MNTDRFKFRLWCKETKKYYQDEEFCINATGSIVIQTEFEETPWLEDDFIIEQCTGLRDKNGKLIYEGDIVNAKWGPNIIERAVIKRGTSGAFRLVDGRRPIITVDETHDKEIIGNIHKGDSK